MLVLLCLCSRVCVALSHPLHEAFEMEEQGRGTVLLPCYSLRPGTTTSVMAAVPMSRPCHGTLAREEHGVCVKSEAGL